MDNPIRIQLQTIPLDKQVVSDYCEGQTGLEIVPYTMANPLEMADQLEVMHALMRLHQIESMQLEAEQRKRFNSRGGFEKKLKLLWKD